MSNCKHKCMNVNPPYLDRCAKCGKSYYLIIEKLQDELDELKKELSYSKKNLKQLVSDGLRNIDELLTAKENLKALTKAHEEYLNKN